MKNFREVINESHSEKNQSQKHRVEMLFDERHHRGADRVCDYLRQHYRRKVGDSSHNGACRRRDVHAHAGRDFIFDPV